VPAGTSPAIVARLSDAIVKVMHLPDVKERVQATGAVPVGDTPEQFATFMAKERARLGDVIAKSGIALKD
jgi:tripartite-type tricarboxylate transporter receptor subunit TctC